MVLIPNRAKTDEQRLDLVKSYKTSVELMDYAKCFSAILDVSLGYLESKSNSYCLQLTLCMLRNAFDSETMVSVVDVLHRYAAIWPCMDAIPAIVSALDDAYQHWKARGLQSRPLLGLLVEFDNGRHLAEGSRNQIMSDITAFMTVSLSALFLGTVLTIL